MEEDRTETEAVVVADLVERLLSPPYYGSLEAGQRFADVHARRRASLSADVATVRARMLTQSPIAVRVLDLVAAELK